jgi:Undecaprenyl-phosphate galactose phosphotransferase WbaP
MFFMMALLPFGYAAAGLYPGFGVGAVETIRRLSYCTSFGFAILASSAFALGLTFDLSRLTFALGWLLSLASVPLLRFALLYYASSLSWWGEPVLVAGQADQVSQTVLALRSALTLGYHPVAAWVPGCRSKTLVGLSVEGRDWNDPPQKLDVRVIIVADSSVTFDMIDYLQQRFRHVIAIRDLGGVPVEPSRVFNLGGTLGIEFTNNLLRLPNRFLKRAMDVVVGSGLLICALPLICLAAIMIKVTSSGPALYSQMREGFSGRPIRVWKLRTMHVDAEERLRALLTESPDLKEEWERNYKLERDPRIVRGIGRLLRRSSIDELPQLWSVVIGEMSLVGPRPFPPYHIESFDEPFRELRRSVRPGLSGMWQVMVRGDRGVDLQQQYDTYYIRNWSVWLDFYILARTFVAVAVGRGAY